MNLLEKPLTLICRCCNLLHLFCISIGLPNISDIEVSRRTCLAVSGSISWSGSTSSLVSYNITLRSSDGFEVINVTMNTLFEFTGLMAAISYTATIVSISEKGNGLPSMITFYIPTEGDATLSGIYVYKHVSIIKYIHAVMHLHYICICAYILM